MNQRAHVFCTAALAAKEKRTVKAIDIGGAFLNDSAPNTQGGIAMNTTGNNTGTIFMWRLSTEKIVRRNHFTILPMPESVIKLLNDLAAKKGRTREAQLKEVDPSTETAIADPNTDFDLDPVAPLPTMMDIFPGDRNNLLGVGVGFDAGVEVEDVEDEAEPDVPHETDLDANELASETPSPRKARLGSDGPRDSPRSVVHQSFH